LLLFFNVLEKLFDGLFEVEELAVFILWHRLL
jgi:hypothetical protein